MIFLWYMFSLWYFLWYFFTTQATPLQYHMNLCGPFHPCGILWYYTVPYKYHSTAVWSLCGITFLCGISYGIFRTTWVPQATPLQYHMNMCGTSSSLWYFLWYYIVP